MDEDTFIYRIDSNDIIVSVSQNWESFARFNAWGSELSPENVIGHLLWDFIQDIEIRHLYEEVFRKVLTGCNYDKLLNRPFWHNFCFKISGRVFPIN